MLTGLSATGAIEKSSSRKDKRRGMSTSAGSIGYRLAFNLIKAGRHTEAIDICTQVLNFYPNYPQIKEEILDKALMALME